MTYTVIDTFRMLLIHHQFQEVTSDIDGVSETCLLQRVSFLSGIMKWPPFSFYCNKCF